MSNSGAKRLNELIIALLLFFIPFDITIATLATFFDMAITNGCFFTKQPSTSSYHYIPEHSYRAHSTLASLLGSLSLKPRPLARSFCGKFT
jgi:hypothetical protein